MCLRVVLASILTLALGLPSYSDEAKTAYQRGKRAEAKEDYDGAFEAFRQAYSLKSKESKYITAYLRSRASAAARHVKNGIKLRDNLKYQEALDEFQRASAIDATSFVAVQEMQRTVFLIRKRAEAEATWAVSVTFSMPSIGLLCEAGA